MIASSLCKYIKANVPDLPRAYVFDKVTSISEDTKPIVIASYLANSGEQWVLGDAQRQQKTRIQLSLYCSTETQRRDLTNKLQTAIEKATALDASSITQKGIDYFATWDILTNSGDNKNYTSAQPNWYTTPAPVIYKNGDLTANIVPAIDYTVASTTGIVTFGSANLVTDKIYATYKVGIVDFVISDMVNGQVTDIANKIHRFNTIITLTTWYLIKNVANKIL